MHSSSGRQSPSFAAASRYRLTANSNGPKVEIDDRLRRQTIMGWRGDLARRLLAKSELLRAAARCNSLTIDKAEVQQLALLATALEYGEKDGHEAADKELRAAELLWERLRDIDIRIPSFHSRVARLLFRYSGEHLSAVDARCLAQLRFPNHDAGSLQECFDDLVRWGVVQRITVGPDAFYDLDIEPHLHVFDTRTRQLTDAPKSGTLIQ